VLVPGVAKEFSLVAVVNITGMYTVGKNNVTLFGYQFFLSHDPVWSADDVNLGFSGTEHAEKLKGVFSQVLI
jgi:hypothetical protein